MAYITGTSGNDFIHVAGDGRTPPPGYNDMPLADAGDDTISSGGGGNDHIFAGTGYNEIGFQSDWNGDDIVNGAVGLDYIVIHGRANTTLTATSLVDVEFISFEAFSLPVGKKSFHSVVMHDANVGAGKTIDLIAANLPARIDFRLDFSAETDAGRFRVFGGAGNDTIIGRSAANGAYADDIFADRGGNDTIVTGGTVEFGGAFNASDRVDGLGTAVVHLNGDYAGNLVLADANLHRVSLIRTGPDSYNGPGSEFSYSFIVDESLATASHSVRFELDQMPGTSVFIDATSNAVGRILVRGGAADDTFFGGGDNDTMDHFGLGADTFIGGGGNDRVTQWRRYVDPDSQIGGDDRLDGGVGTDMLRINGPYPDGLVLDGVHIADFEIIVVGAEQIPNLPASLIVLDPFLTAGETLIVDASALIAGSPLTFTAVDETNARVEVTGGAAADTVTGSQGNDFLSGGTGNDRLNGSGGVDELRGGTGNDTMIGGPGNDRYFVDAAGDQTVEASGTGGIDTVFSAVSWLLSANVDHLRLQGTANLNGTGNGLNNKISGTTGNNFLQGLDGNDELSGNDGADTLAGGAGNDTMSGGSQADVFRFTITNAGADTITDFNKNADRFDLGGGSFSKLVIAPDGDVILTHNGGTIRIDAPLHNLTLAQYNALVLPSGWSADAPSPAWAHLSAALLPQGHLDFF